MSEQLPEPLVPMEVDLRDMDGFMLNAERLLASELWALSTGEEMKAALGLWCRAWKQIPGASLPNNDRILASFAGTTLQRWRRIKDMAMRGFILCSDGRYYHRVLAEDALRAWGRKQVFKERSARGNAKRWSGNSLQHEQGGGEAGGKVSQEEPPDHHRHEQQGATKESFKDARASNKESYKESLSFPRDSTGLDRTRQDTSPLPSPSPPENKNHKNGFHSGNGSGDGAPSLTIKDPTQRIARFQQKIVKHLGGGPLSWDIVYAACDRTSPKHATALAQCQQAARELGKGWPKGWPLS